jgi:hypothetical protein
MAKLNFLGFTRLIFLPVIAIQFSTLQAMGNPTCHLDTLISQSNKCDYSPILLLSAYEPNSVGLVFDDDENGSPFLDFKISMMYPLLPLHLEWDRFEYIYNKMNNALYHVRPYFGFTTRLGQYIGTRSSSPVIGKRFNPFLFLRWDAAKSIPGYLNFADVVYFAHESNGQFISSEPMYTLQSNQSGKREARDLISRGWDYFGLTLNHKLIFGKRTTFNGYLKYRHFLDNGWLQGGKEEYESWENDPMGAPRNEFHGIEFISSFEFKYPNNIYWGKCLRIVGSLETGEIKPFKNLTLGGAITTTSGTMPIRAWFTYGFGKDIAMYYEKGWSVGIGYELKSLGSLNIDKEI